MSEVLTIKFDSDKLGECQVEADYTPAFAGHDSPKMGVYINSNMAELENIVISDILGRNRTGEVSETEMGFIEESLWSKAYQEEIA